MIVTPGQLNRRATFYHQLGSMIGAGVPLPKALQMVSASPAVGASRKAASGILEHLQSGFTFSESMSRVQGWMPDFDTALLSVGEQSGRLDQSFKLLSEYYAARAKLIRDTISGMVVTLATLHVFLLLIPIDLWIGFGRGILEGHYESCIPFLVEKFVVFGVLYGWVFLSIYASQGNRAESWRAFVEKFAGLIPILRTARKYLSLSRMAAALEALTSAGVSVVSGWQLAAAASASPRLRHIVSQWETEISDGSTPGELINRSGYFPEMFANLYFTGEQSGKLDDTLHRLQIYYQEEGFRTLRFFTRIVNGIIYGSMVVIVGLYVIRFWTNYYGALVNSV
jgi:type II secretory pathway component PulF